MKWIIATGTAAALLAGVGAANAQTNWRTNDQGYQRGQMMERDVGPAGWTELEQRHLRHQPFDDAGQLDLQLECVPLTAAVAAIASGRRLLKHDPERWAPVFGKDHAPTIGAIAFVRRQRPDEKPRNCGAFYSSGTLFSGFPSSMSASFR